MMYVTTVRKGENPNTSLVDLHGSMIGADADAEVRELLEEHYEVRTYKIEPHGGQTLEVSPPISNEHAEEIGRICAKYAYEDTDKHVALVMDAIAGKIIAQV